jgi:hypothetical protein
MDCYYIFAGAWAVLIYFVMCLSYLVYRKATDPPPLDYLGGFKLIYRNEEETKKKIEDEADEIKKLIYQDRLNTYAIIKRELKKIAPEA